MQRRPDRNDTFNICSRQRDGAGMFLLGNMWLENVEVVVAVREGRGAHLVARRQPENVTYSIQSRCIQGDFQFA